MDLKKLFLNFSIILVTVVCLIGQVYNVIWQKLSFDLDNNLFLASRLLIGIPWLIVSMFLLISPDYLIRIFRSSSLGDLFQFDKPSFWTSARLRLLGLLWTMMLCVGLWYILRPYFMSN